MKARLVVEITDGKLIHSGELEMGMTTIDIAAFRVSAIDTFTTQIVALLDLTFDEFAAMQKLAVDNNEIANAMNKTENKETLNADMPVQVLPISPADA